MLNEISALQGHLRASGGSGFEPPADEFVKVPKAIGQSVTVKQVPPPTPAEVGGTLTRRRLSGLLELELPVRLGACCAPGGSGGPFAGALPGEIFFDGKAVAVAGVPEADKAAFHGRDNYLLKPVVPTYVVARGQIVEGQVSLIWGRSFQEVGFLMAFHGGLSKFDEWLHLGIESD